MKKQPKPSDWIIIGGGAVMLIASFLDFVSASVKIGKKTISHSFSAWSGDFLSPLSLWPVLFGLAMGIVVALELFAGINLPERILSFTWNQIHFVLAAWSVLLMLAFVILDKQGLDAGIGLWLMLLASIALVVGAVLRMKETPGVAPAGGTYQPPTPF